MSDAFMGRNRKVLERLKTTHSWAEKTTNRKKLKNVFSRQNPNVKKWNLAKIAIIKRMP